MKKLIIFTLCISFFITATGCNVHENKADEISINGWIVDWDFQSGINEIEKSQYYFDDLSYFAIYFNEDGSLYKKENFNNNLESIRKESSELYITVVNDVIKKQNTIEKDSDTIHNILNDDKKKEKHIDELLNLAYNNAVTGVELDYENIQEKDWIKYISFIEKLGSELSSKGKKLRVVLQSSAPIDKLNFPKEYEYIVMVYNLYGSKTEGGPKADKDYIEDVCSKFNGKIKNLRLAFSLSGAEWIDNGQYRSLSRKNIKEIIDKYSIDAIRDKKSDALYFTYKDEENNTCVVWYSDDNTIKSWMNIAKSKGINKFSIWRLGGNI